MNDVRLDDPHGDQPVRTAGAPLAEARVAMVLVHGRGASAESILTLAPALAAPGVVFVAPQAAGGTWYPNGFMAPIASNEPGISSGMRAIERALAQVAAAGIALEHTVLLGFSQGACLATEFAARHARRRRHRRLERRPHRARRHAARLLRNSRRHACVPRLQRRGLPHPRSARARERRNPAPPGRRRHAAALSRHGPSRERRRDRRGAPDDRRRAGVGPPSLSGG